MTYKAGDIVEGKVTGIQPYGAFISIDKNTNGLIHISELSDGFVKDIHQYVRVGDVVKVKVIEYDEESHHAKLSLKALQKVHTRNRKKPIESKASLPSMRIGFQSIAQHMDEWIKEAKENKE